MCYFYFGVVIAFILCFFKYREGESEKGKNKVKIEDHIVNVNLMNSNDNDLLNLKINEIKDKSNKNEKKEIMLTTLFDDMESEKGEQWNSKILMYIISKLIIWYDVNDLIKVCVIKYN